MEDQYREILAEYSILTSMKWMFVFNFKSLINCILNLYENRHAQVLNAPGV